MRDQDGPLWLKRYWLGLILTVLEGIDMVLFAQSSVGLDTCIGILMTMALQHEYNDRLRELY